MHSIDSAIVEQNGFRTINQHSRNAPRILLTPGPLTTSELVRDAMKNDYGSRDAEFIATTRSIRQKLVRIVNGEASHVAVPLAGCGTSAVEATISTLMRKSDALLVLINGAYGERIYRIAVKMGRNVVALHWPEDVPIDSAMVRSYLRENTSVTHVALVHCETTTGILNPIEKVAAVVSQEGKSLILDAMSSFGALPLDVSASPATAIVASSNKCLEGTPGISFAIVEKQALENSEGNSSSTVLDLFGHWKNFEENGQWQFTPPVQVVAALDVALNLLDDEGGPTGRNQRYQQNMAVLIEGMKTLGFECLLDLTVQAPVIATLHSPKERWYEFTSFYKALADRGFLIYPGKVSGFDTFRVGCIGAIDAADLRRFISTVKDVRDSSISSSPKSGAPVSFS